MDPEAFSDSTDEGFIEATGNRYRDQILSLLADYRALSPRGTSVIEDKNVTKALSYVNAMVDFAEDYLRQPTTASEPEARAGYWAFLLKARERQRELVKQSTTAVGPQAKVPVDPRARSLRKHMLGDGSTLFDKVGWAVDHAVPKNGDKASFAIELDFPTPWGFNAQGGMMVSAERSEDRLKAFARITMGAGVGNKEILQLSATISGYLEAEAQDAKTLGALLERALYERVKGSAAVPDEVAGYLFGTGGDKGGQLVAKERMAAIDDKRFQKDNYAESGGIIEAKGVSDGMGSVVGGRTSGSRLDQKGAPQRSVEGFNVTVTIERPVGLEFQVQGKTLDPGTKKAQKVANEFTAEFLLDQAMLMKLAGSADAASIATLLLSSARQAVGLVAELVNSKDSQTPLTTARLFAGLTMANSQLVYHLMQLKDGLPDPNAPEAKKKFGAKAKLGIGLKVDMAKNKVSVIGRHISEVSVDLGTVKATGTRSSEFSLGREFGSSAASAGGPAR